MGLVVFSVGLVVFSVGLVVFSVGLVVFSVGLVVFSVGLVVFSCILLSSRVSCYLQSWSWLLMLSGTPRYANNDLHSIVLVVRIDDRYARCGGR